MTERPAIVQNPILPGFNPDPSLVRVGNDYYLATSTFEWFPGVQIHHSRDLVHWELVAHPLQRLSQLDMRGETPSCGIWAPCLSYCDGTFYLIYTDVKNNRGLMNDTPNYLVTAPAVTGPWSEPIFLNASGFDPSLFHDRDGRKWLVNMLHDYRPYKNTFSGIVMQEYSEQEKKLIGPRRVIFGGTSMGCTEGPHLYRHGDYYYLMCAEGGTGYAHGVTVARSHTLFGPYEPDPNGPMLSSRHMPWAALQKAGHASLVEGDNGHWYLAHLCARPVGEKRRCILGRETALQEVYFTDDGWLRMKNGTDYPAEKLALPTGGDSTPTCRNMHEDFDGPFISPHLQSLREPLGNRADLTARPGWLRLRGGQSLFSHYGVSLLAHRQQSFYCQAETRLSFAPDHFQHLAGLTYFYDELNHISLAVTRHETLGRVLTMIRTRQGESDLPLGAGIPLPEEGDVRLQVCTRKETAHFFYAVRPGPLTAIGPELDATLLSDDAYEEIGQMRFTGAFLGIFCIDLDRYEKSADFAYFSYTETEGL